jgi:MYXO-CTERM domain-containing protein
MVSLLVAILGFGATAHAQIVVGNEVTAEDIVHTYFYDDIEGGSANDFLVGQTYGATPVEFTANLGSNTVFTYTMSAPAGMVFSINPAENGTSRLQSYIRWKSGSYVGPQSVDSVSFSFGDLSGVAPGAISSGASITKSGGQVIAMQVYSEAILSPISFSSFSISLTFSGVTSGSQAYTLHDGHLYLSSSGLSSDPGQLITLSAVPEPASVPLALGMIALGLVGVRRRRR